ncbi:MAG: hypothetical protein R6X02_33775 [Enhygromyxa sp.]
MSEIDQRTSKAVARLRDEWSPPSGIEERMLADLHARLDGGGPPDGGEPPAGDGGAASGGASGQWLYVAKLLGAVAGLTAAGLGGVVVVAKLLGSAERPASPAREQAVALAVDERGAADEIEAADEVPEPSAVEPGDPEPAPSLAVSQPRSRPRPRSEPEPQVDLAAELALIRQARAAKPEQALALLERHRREFPGGALTSEREALRATASCTLDRLDEARAAVEQLVAHNPGPLLRKRVEAACAEKIDLPTTGFLRGGDGSL